MTKSKRALLQILLWLFFWSIILLNQGFSWHFLKDNLPAFIFQTVTIISIIWIIAPYTIYKSKHFLFIVISLSIIGFGAYLSSNFMPNSGPDIPPPNPMAGKADRPIPSQLFIHLLLIGIAYSISTMFEFFVYAQKKEKEHILSKNETLQTELKLLKSQINPHFLFNALNNIYALAAINTEKTQQSISYLSDMLRYVLYECEHRLVALDKEILYIQNYIKLFSLKRSVQYPIHTVFDIQSESIRVAPMLFIPFVENALKHSNIENIHQSFINISLYADTRIIDFSVENSIPQVGIHKDKIGGIGIDNVKRRLDILYPKQHQLELQQDQKMFKVTLKLFLDGKD